MLRDLCLKKEDQTKSLALQEKLFLDLMERAKELDEEQARLLAAMQMTEEEIEDIVENRKIFSPEQWEKIVAQFEEEHPEWRATQSASDMRKTRQSLSEVRPDWLFVK